MPLSVCWPIQSYRSSVWHPENNRVSNTTDDRGIFIRLTNGFDQLQGKLELLSGNIGKKQENLFSLKPEIPDLE